MKVLTTVSALALAAVISLSSPPKAEAGCIGGAIAGAIVGHMAGKAIDGQGHAVLGAVGGCAAGIAAKKAAQAKAEAAHIQPVAGTSTCRDDRTGRFAKCPQPAASKLQGLAGKLGSFLAPK